MAGKSAVQTLGKKKIFFLARSDSWGWDMRDGAYAASFGAEIVGYDEASLGTSDFTTILQGSTHKPGRPDRRPVRGQTGGTPQAGQQMGLGRGMTIFNAFMTNVVAEGLPPQKLQGVYAMHYFYYDLSTFSSHRRARRSSPNCSAPSTRAPTQTPTRPSPTSPTWRCSVVSRRRSRSIRKRLRRLLMANGGKFDTVKGPATKREDHSAVYKYAAFLVKGKGAKRKQMGSVQRGRLPGRRNPHCQRSRTLVTDPCFDRAVLAFGRANAVNLRPNACVTHALGRNMTKGFAVVTSAPSRSGRRCHRTVRRTGRRR